MNMKCSMKRRPCWKWVVFTLYVLPGIGDVTWHQVIMVRRNAFWTHWLDIGLDIGVGHWVGHWVGHRLDIRLDNGHWFDIGFDIGCWMNSYNSDFMTTRNASIVL